MENSSRTTPSRFSPRLTSNDSVDTKLQRASRYHSQVRYNDAFKIYEPLAKQGNPIAQRWLAGMYRHGQHVNVDFVQALTWYVKAAKHGDAEISKVALIRIEEVGEDIFVQGIRPTYTEEWEGIPPEAIRALQDVYTKIGKMYREGNDRIQRSEKKAHTWYDRAYALGSATHAVDHARLPDQKAELLAQAAKFYEANEPIAAYIICVFLADHDHVEALEILANMYWEGVGVWQDEDRAIRCMEKAAKIGDPNAYYRLAKRYFDGDGLCENVAIAANYLEKAAALLVCLQECHRDDIEMVKDIKEAEDYAKRAALNGHPRSLDSFFDVYWLGSQGINADVEKAKVCAMFAAQHGYPKTLSRLAMYYLDGTGVDKNTEKADEYAKMALENGFCEVNEWLQKKRAEYQGARSSSSVSELSLLDVAQESALPEIHPDSSVVPLNDAPIKTEIRNVEHSSAAFDEERSWEQAGFWPDALVSGEGTEAPPSRLQSELLLETAHFYYGKGMMSEAFQLFDELASMGNEHGKFFVAKMIMEGNDPSGAMKKATRYATELGMDVGAKLAHNVDLDKARFSEIKEAHQHFEENIRPGDLTSKIVPENSSCSVESGTEKRQTPRLITINYQTS